ncbi:MAG TPA: glycosyltransferase [Nitrospirales bacterium]|nr:glycosyltransferase [Nitrospirales bacterium]
MTPHVSLFIPSYNDGPDLMDCIESLRRLQYPKDRLELVVWDNASRDDTAARVRARFAAMAHEGWASLRLIEHDRNDGCYVPYNLVLERLVPESEYVLGLDADVELAPDVVTRLVAAARQERVGVVGARSVVHANPRQTAHGAGFVNRWTAKYSERDPDGCIDCDYVIGCCWLFDRRVFAAVGGFAPDFVTNHWEVDFCLRVRAQGWRVCYDGRAVARHKIAYPPVCATERLYYMFRNKLLMIRRNPYFSQRALSTALCVAMSCGGVLARLVRDRRVADARLALQGLYDGVRGIAGPQPTSS